MANITLNILIVGLGGQGVIFASDIIAQIFINKNLVVKKSEIHGLSQRGGPVASHLRVGKQIFSPVIPKGEVDFLLAVDEKEGQSWKNNLRTNGTYLTAKKNLTKENPNSKLVNIFLVSQLFKTLPKNYFTKNKITQKDIMEQLQKKLKDKTALAKNIEIVNKIFSDQK